jgi:hypothetical protein
MASIIVDGEIYRVVGMLDNGFMMAVMDINDIGRVLVRDHHGGPWRRWMPARSLPTAPPEEPEERPHR